MALHSSRYSGVVLFDNEPLKTGVTNCTGSEECSWATATGSGSLPNTTIAYVLLSCMLDSTLPHMCCFNWETYSFVLYKLPINPVCIMLIAWHWWHQPSCFLVAKYIPLCVPLWRHRSYCCNIVMSRIENNTTNTLVEKFKLLMNINEWVAHVQHKLFTATREHQWFA